MIKLFDDYSDLFDGTLGRAPGKPVSLTLKPNAVPFCSCPYTIPMAIKKSRAMKFRNSAMQMY
eukprot:5648130-Ditylum_brightwellii.AAC.1